MQQLTKLVGKGQQPGNYLPSKRAYFVTCYALKNLNTLGDIHHFMALNYANYGRICPSFKHLLNNKTGLQQGCNPFF